MDNDDYKTLIAEYEKLNAERPDMYPLSFDEYTERLKNSFLNPNYLSAPKEKQVKVALLWMKDGRSLMKYYNAFKMKDMELLNNALFETAHLMQISNISATGTDHGFYGMSITPNLLAANMMERIKLVLPKENGLGKWSFSGTHIANLLMAILYKDFEFKGQALELSEKELNRNIDSDSDRKKLDLTNEAIEKVKEYNKENNISQEKMTTDFKEMWYDDPVGEFVKRQKELDSEIYQRILSLAKKWNEKNKEKGNLKLEKIDELNVPLKTNHYKIKKK